MNIINSVRKKSIIITGGAGFIGSAVIRHLIRDTSYNVINIDKLTYAGNLESLKDVSNSPQYTFEQIDICNQSEIIRIFKQYEPDFVMHLAAESHVDRSIDAPAKFIHTNIIGTYTMLEAACQYWIKLNKEKKKIFRFLHISTDEVYGDLKSSESLFTERTAYAPSSPYSASKASSDHLARAWNRTYKLPVIITNCSNNYGPYQFPDKLIPLVITNAIIGKSLPIYGEGKQIRDWLFVEDHAEALVNVLIARSRGDRKNLNNELEKIENFSLNKKNLNIQEIIKLTNLADNYSASELVDHSLAKNTRKTVTILGENNYSDEDNIIIIRTLLAKLKRLVKIYDLIDEKNNIEQAISACKPPIFWKDKPLVTQQIRSWKKDGLEQLIYKTNEIELLVKKNSVLAKNILADFIINNSKKTNN